MYSKSNILKLNVNKMLNFTFHFMCRHHHSNKFCISTQNVWVVKWFKHDSMQGLLDMMIAEEESLKQRLMDSIASCRKELQKLSQELQLPPFEVNILVVSSWLVYCKSSLHYSLFLLHQNSRNCQRHSTNCTHHLLYGRGVFEGEVHILSQSTIYSQHSFCCWL